MPMIIMTSTKPTATIINATTKLVPITEPFQKVPPVHSVASVGGYTKASPPPAHVLQVWAQDMHGEKSGRPVRPNERLGGSPAPFTAPSPHGSLSHNLHDFIALFPTPQTHLHHLAHA